MTFVLFSTAGLLVLFFGRWLHWVSRPSHTDHVTVPRGVRSQELSSLLPRGIWLEVRLIWKDDTRTLKRLIPDEFYMCQASRLFCFELSSMSEIITDNRHQICTYYLFPGKRSLITKHPAFFISFFLTFKCNSDPYSITILLQNCIIERGGMKSRRRWHFQ